MFYDHPSKCRITNLGSCILHGNPVWSQSQIWHTSLNVLQNIKMFHYVKDNLSMFTHYNLSDTIHTLAHAIEWAGVKKLYQNANRARQIAACIGTFKLYDDLWDHFS